MEVKQLVALLIKIFALALAIFTINNAVNTISFLNEATLRSVAYYQIASSICVLLVAFLLWFFPFSVAGKILPTGIEREFRIGGFGYEDMRAICFTTLALYLLYNVMSDAIYWGSFFVIFNANPSSSFEISPYDKASIFATVIELIILLPLLFGRKGFAKLFYKIRYGN